MEVNAQAHLLLQLLKYSETTTQGKGHVLNMDNFIDTTNIEGRFEFSEWVRAYGKYLDEQLEVYQRINFYQVCQNATTMYAFRASAEMQRCLTHKLNSTHLQNINCSTFQPEPDMLSLE